MTDDPGADRESLLFLVDEALGYLSSAALRAVASAGVADALADGPLTLAELGKQVGADPRALYRVLRLLATRGIFEELGDGRFRLTERGRALRSDGPMSARAAILMLTHRTLWRPAGEMEGCLEKGASIFNDLFDMSFFEYFAQDAQVAMTFHSGMAAMSDWENAPIAAACDLPESGVVVDLGGGLGGLLLEVLLRRRSLFGVLFDQAHALAGHRLGARETDGRWEAIPGDFFTEVPPGDVYLLKRVMHDWDDDQCVTILTNCRRAMADGGRVLVLDAVIPPGNEPHQAKAVDLMLMASLTGRERTADEFARLFEAAGLRLVRVVPTGTALSIVEAVAAAT
ncbi:methyltransferase [Spongiactinospora sp. TRM90649]|uniref:methyltransferase n=1 Tax=Spongiactinospora sp. TRM90649 TaxID=3031114 RepID=UPI0023F7FE43|nr:methyltransferase [Spongiactinospora sp. TRM90649]